MIQNNTMVWKTAQGNAVTDTWMVAKGFGKRNANLCKSVQTLLAKMANDNTMYFETQRFVPELGRAVRVYMMTEQGFIRLMGACRECNPDIMVEWKREFDETNGRETTNEPEPEQPATGEQETPENEQTDVYSHDFSFPADKPLTIPNIFRWIGESFELLMTEADALERKLREREHEIEMMRQEQERRKTASPVQPSKPVQGIGHNCSMNELAKMIRSYGIETGEIRLYEWMRANNFLCQFGTDYNLPTQQAIGQGLFIVEPGSYTHPKTGQQVQTRTTRVTEKGQIYFINKFLYNQQQE